MAQADLEGGHRAFAQALEIMQRLAAREPQHSGWQRDLLVSHSKLGDALSQRGNLEESRLSYEQALEIAQRLASWEPENTGWQRDVSMSLVRLGEVLREQGNFGEARCAFEQALEIAQRLVALEPEHTGWQMDLVFAQFTLAGILALGSNPERAEAARLLIQGRDTLRLFAANSRLTHAEQHKLLPSIEGALETLVGSS